MMSRAMICEMQVAMQLARIDRMRGIVIVDPVVHGAGVRQNRGSGAGTGGYVMR